MTYKYLVVDKLYLSLFLCLTACANKFTSAYFVIAHLFNFVYLHAAVSVHLLAQFITINTIFTKSKYYAATK